MKQFKFAGELPRGDWTFCIVAIKDQPDVIVVVDRTGQNEPRMIIGDRMFDLTAA